MTEIARINQLTAITAWARARRDIRGLAVVGSWARGAEQPDSDIDLILLAHDPLSFRRDRNWPDEIEWDAAHLVRWHDADYGAAWSRHVHLQPPCEIEFTFCAPSWAAVDPVDAGTVNVMLGGCRVLFDRERLLERLMAAVTSRTGIDSWSRHR